MCQQSQENKNGEAASSLNLEQSGKSRKDKAELTLSVGQFLVALGIVSSIIIALFTTLFLIQKHNYDQQIYIYEETYSDKAWVNTYLQTYGQLTETFVLIARRLIHQDNLWYTTWQSEDYDSARVPLQRMAITLKNVRKELILMGQAKDEDLQNYESPEFCYGIAKMLFYAYADPKSTGQDVSEIDILSMLSQGLAISNSKNIFKEKNGYSFFVRAWLERVSALEYASKSEVGLYHDRQGISAKYLDSILAQKQIPEDLRNGAISLKRAIYISDYCVDPDEKTIRSLGKFLESNPCNVNLVTIRSLSKDAANAVAHHFNLFEYYISIDSIRIADTILSRLRIWAANNADSLAEQKSTSMWARFRKKVTECELMLKWKKYFADIQFRIRNGSENITPIEHFLKLFEKDSMMVNLDTTSYAYDITWLYFHGILLLYPDSLITQTRKVNIAEMVKNRIKKKKNDWYYDLYEKYPSLPIRRLVHTLFED